MRLPMEVSEMEGKNLYQGIVQKIVQGKHGPYAVASEPKMRQVTFALTPDVWAEEDWPEAGTIVVLSRVMKKRAGWRAKQARFLRPGEGEEQ